MTHGHELREGLPEGMGWGRLLDGVGKAAKIGTM